MRIVILAGVVAAAGHPALAQTGIIRSRKTASSTWNPLAPITIGGGVEFETNDEQAQFDYPLVLEYNPIEQLKFTFETAVVHIDGKMEDVRTVTGLDDLETSIEYEFMRERRYTPALTALGLIRWPTATDSDIGSPGSDYAIGLVASKDLVFMDLDLNALYTISGDPDQQDLFEISLAAEYPLNYRFTIEAEVRRAIGADNWRGSPRGRRESGNQTEFTLGLAWLVTNKLKFEQGVTVRDDGSWQILFSWSYAFGGQD